MTKVLLTMMGRSVWGLFNSVWASIRQFDYLPDRVYVLMAGCEAPRAGMATDMLVILLKEHGSPAKVEMVNVPGDDIKEIGRVAGEILTKEKEKGSELAVDGELLAVVVYRKGAVAIADMLMRMRGRKEAGDAA